MVVVSWCLPRAKFDGRPLLIDLTPF